MLFFCEMKMVAGSIIDSCFYMVWEMRSVKL